MQEFDLRRDIMVPYSLQGQQQKGLTSYCLSLSFRDLLQILLDHPGGQVRYYTKVGGVICRGVRP